MRYELIWVPIRKDAERIWGDQVAGVNDITNLKWLLIDTTLLDRFRTRCITPNILDRLGKRKV